MSNQRDSMKRLDDTPVRIVSHRLEASGSAASRPGDARVRAGAGESRQERTERATNRDSQLPQIVLVDRDVDALREIAVALRDQFDFHVTISGNEALNLLQSGAIDAIVVGQTLYSSTGINVLAEARRRAPHTQRVLLANAVEATDIDRDSAPAQPFRILNRPCTPQKLLELFDAGDDPQEEETNEGSEFDLLDSAPVEKNRTAPIAVSTRVKQAPPNAPAALKTSAVYHGEYEHVILETPPDLPRRKPRGAVAPKSLENQAMESLPIVVYTDNGEFYQSVCGALQDRYEIRLATQLERAVEMAEMGSCPILITDRAGTQTELQRISIAIRAAEPCLVTIASGTPAEGLALRKLLNTPALHSFLPKPLSVPLIRLSIESAKRLYAESKRPVQLTADTTLEDTPRLSVQTNLLRSGTRQSFRPMQGFEQNYDIEDRFDFRRLIPYAWIAALFAIVLGGAGWYWQAQNRKEAELAVLLDAELDLARRAYQSGDYAAPENANALYFYRRVLKRDANHAEALQGIDNVAERLVEQTEQQLTEDKLDAASASVTLLRELRPGHKRLAFLEGQINKAKGYRQSQKLAEQSAEVARSEAARASTAHASLLESRMNEEATAGLISNSVQRTQAVARWLATGRQRLTQGRLVAPETDSAEYYFRLAERADPNNPAVDQGLRDVGTRLLADAQDALTRQQLDLARRKLSEAARFGPDPTSVARMRGQIDAAAESGVRSNFLKLTLQRTRENALFEPAQDNAKYYLSQLQRLDSSSAEVREATRAIALKLIDNANQATSQRQFNIAIRLLDETRRLGFSGPELKDADSRLLSARLPPTIAPAVNSTAAAPKIVKSVPAKFPEDAMQAGVSGWVDVGFKINAAGDVYDAVPIASNPPGSYASKFERAAVAAISQYKFERRPISDAQTQSMVVRVQFKLK